MKGNESKPHIGIFGRRNYGKSSLINFITEQNVAIVSSEAGTTTDPVKKSMELLGVGPVVWVDTAGIDDKGSLGQLRIDKSFEILPQCDLILLLFAHNEFSTFEQEVVSRCQDAKVPFLLIYALSDQEQPNQNLINKIEREYQCHIFALSTLNPELRAPLSEQIRQALPESSYKHKSLLGDVIQSGDTVLMVTPIDSSAPEGRMILPQVQVLRDILDNNAKAVVCRETELEQTLKEMKNPPRLVVTDSQVFDIVSKIVPQDVYLTSFSVVLARAKGLFPEYVAGTPHIDQLQDGDSILILESCTHDVTCEDIGRVKLPTLIRKKTGKQLHFDIVPGLTRLERPITDYSLVIQCGGCVITSKQLASRLMPAIQAGVPVSNYGLALAYLTGIFHRSMAIFNKISNN